MSGSSSPPNRLSRPAVAVVRSAKSAKRGKPPEPTGRLAGDGYEALARPWPISAVEGRPIQRAAAIADRDLRHRVRKCPLDRRQTQHDMAG